MYLIIIVGLVAAYVAFTKSPQKALLNVYFPVLFLCRDYYRWVIAGLPDPTFSEAAILPIALVFVIKGAPGWRFTITDAIVVGFAFCEGLSQYLATGYGDAQNLIFDMLGVVILPYVLAKALIEPSGMRVQFAKRLIVLLAIVAATEVYEFRMVNNVFKQILGP